MSYSKNLAALLYAICRKPDVKICRSRDAFGVLVYARNELIRIQCMHDRGIVYDFNKQRVERILAEFSTVCFNAKSSEPDFAELVNVFSRSTDSTAVPDEILHETNKLALARMNQLAETTLGKKTGGVSIAELFSALCQRPDIQLCRSSDSGACIMGVIENLAIKFECQNGGLADPEHHKIESINVLFCGAFFNLDSNDSKFEELVSTLKKTPKSSDDFHEMMDGIFKSAVSSLTELSA